MRRRTFSRAWIVAASTALAVIASASIGCTTEEKACKNPKKYRTYDLSSGTEKTYDAALCIGQKKCPGEDWAATQYTQYGPPCSAEELPRTLESCSRGGTLSRCASVPSDEVDACQAGCVMQRCRDTTPETIARRALESSCGDTHGALYWRNAIAAVVTCERQIGKQLSQREAIEACAAAAMKNECPEIASDVLAGRWPGHFLK
jgi:hypothetical protein